MKKAVLVLTLVLGTLVSNAQTKLTQIGSFTSFVKGGVGYGGLVEFGNVGILYNRSANLTNDDPINYIYGKAPIYKAGTDITNVGLYFKANASNSFNAIYGLGYQSVNDITTNGILNNQTVFALLGSEYLISNSPFTIRTDAMFSVYSPLALNLGITYKLK